MEMKSVKKFPVEIVDWDKVKTHVKTIVGCMQVPFDSKEQYALSSVSWVQENINSQLLHAVYSWESILEKPTNGTYIVRIVTRSHKIKYVIATYKNAPLKKDRWSRKIDGATHFQLLKELNPFG